MNPASNSTVMRGRFSIFDHGSVWKNIPSGAKAHNDIAEVLYGLKPVPFKLTHDPIFGASEPKARIPGRGAHAPRRIGTAGIVRDKAFFPIERRQKWIGRSTVRHSADLDAELICKIFGKIIPPGGIGEGGVKSRE